MVLGDFEESLVNSICIINCGPANTVVWLPLVTLLTHWTADFSMGWPSMTPEIMLHSPSNSVAGALAEVAGAAFLDARGFAFAVAGASPRVSVSKAKPLPGVVAKLDGRTVPRVARQSFQLSPSSS